MPYICRDMFEKHAEARQQDDDLHVQPISNPEVAAQIAALKLVMNTNLREKLLLLDTERKYNTEYLRTIINQKNLQEQLRKIIAARQPLVGPHLLAILLQPLFHSLGRSRG